MLIKEFLVSHQKLGICVFRPSALALAPGPGRDLYLTALAPNLYLTAPAINLYLPALTHNLCLPVLRFTVKIFYSYSVYLYKLSVYLCRTVATFNYEEVGHAPPPHNCWDFLSLYKQMA